MAVLLWTPPGMGTTISYTADNFSVLLIFRDVACPAATKNEWGMDVLTREIRGPGALYDDFSQTLAQGQSFRFANQTYYLQTWQPIEDKIFPGYRLSYKGCFSGIPRPFASGRTIQQTLKITCSSPQNASRDITYLTRESYIKYITTSRPSGPSYSSLDAAYAPVIIKSVITDENGKPYFGSAPSDLVTALTVAGTTNTSVTETNPVFGTPYFENMDTVTQFMGPLP